MAVLPGADGTVQAYTGDGTDTEGPVTLTGGEFTFTLERTAHAVTGGADHAGR